MQNNSIVSLTGSLRTMNYLEHLDLSYNHLRNLKKILGGIEHLRFLKSLSLVGNPCCEEPGYRIVVLSTITSLNVLDFKVVTDLERQVAVKKHRNSNKKKIGSPVNGSTNNTTVGNTNSGSLAVCKQKKKISCLSRLQKEAAIIKKQIEAKALNSEDGEDVNNQNTRSHEKIIATETTGVSSSNLDKTSAGRLKTDYFSVFPYGDHETQIQWC